MKTVFLRRKGSPVRGFDVQRQRGWDVAEGAEVELSEFAAMELQRDDGASWEAVRSEVDSPAQDVVRDPDAKR